MSRSLNGRSVVLRVDSLSFVRRKNLGEFENGLEVPDERVE